MATSIEQTGTVRGSAAGRCPIDHSALSQRKTAQLIETAERPLERDGDGVWHVRGFDAARAVLRSTDTKQAGFNAEMLDRMAQRMNPPILYQEGEAHHVQRKLTARFFTPKAVSGNYRRLMEQFADRLIEIMRERKQVDLAMFSMKLAVRVAAEVVGLTNSRIPGMDRRLNAFFEQTAEDEARGPRAMFHKLNNSTKVGLFFLLDVKPAIEARRKQPREDVISHLLSQGATDPEILTECLTYAAAGMATTREFISVAAWHLLEQPGLREQYLSAPEAERQELLQEMLRLEPVVGRLYRRATADISVGAGATQQTIPSGSLIELHLYPINADERAVGDNALLICPERERASERIGTAVMSFGDGHHRCPGAYIAMQETDIFLQRLLRAPGLRISQKPLVRWNPLTAGYEVRNFMLTVD